MAFSVRKIIFNKIWIHSKGIYIMLKHKEKNSKKGKVNEKFILNYSCISDTLRSYERIRFCGYYVYPDADDNADADIGIYSARYCSGGR